MMKVSPRLVRSFQVIALLVMVVMGLITVRRYLAIHDCLDHGHRWDHGHNVCDDR